MDIASVIQILHERRKGFDILALEYERKTKFAIPVDKPKRGRSVVKLAVADEDDEA
ncbi:hypothetical protein [Rhizobium mesosinicum]|uniref:Uncharacterized protein n=1 Tax=Rhizobium mesosinicum TaxID=335017 RepID=A0ABS7GP26_9HYPH|nr:hypothetical protein [Rhizobium mesosinicum]MBW9051160.1 hypothetical protein [Rhizobium mesosinicum]